MDEELKNAAVVEQQPAESAAKNPETEQPKTVTRTQDEDNNLFKQEAIRSKKSVYNKLGVKDDVEFDGLLSKLKTINEAESKAEAERPEIERLRSELDAAKAFEGKYSEVSAKIQAYEQERIVIQHGVSMKPDEPPEDYNERLQDVIALINRRVTDEKEFKDAAADYFKKNPPIPDSPPKPEIHPKTRNTPVPAGITREDFRKLTYNEQYEFKTRYPDKFKEMYGG